MPATEITATLKTARQRPSKLLRKEYLAFYLFASPWLLGLLFFTLGPTIASFVLSFSEYPLIVAPTWIGLTNYANMLTDELVVQALKVTFLYSLGAVPLGLIAAFLIAILMNQGIHGIRVFRTVYYIPAIISGVPVALVWMWVLNPDFGVLNSALRTIGIIGPAWLFSRTWVIPAFIMMSLWSVGAPMVIFPSVVALSKANCSAPEARIGVMVSVVIIKVSLSWKGELP